MGETLISISLLQKTKPKAKNCILFFFGVKLGHFSINNFFLFVIKMQAYQRKTEKFFVSEEKKFGRIDSGKQGVEVEELSLLVIVGYKIAL